MLEIRNLSLAMKKNGRVLVNNLNFTLRDEDKVAIIGEEGNGKSTFLKAIYNRELVEEYCEVEGSVVTNNTRLGYLSQEMEDSIKELSVYDYIGYDYDMDILIDLVNQLHLDLDKVYSHQLMGSLSGGESVKMRMLKLLLNQPDVVLLDEPTNDIDIDTLEWMEDYINESKVPVIYISHDQILLTNTATVTIHLEQIKKKTQAMHTIERMNYEDYVDYRGNKIEHQETVAKKQRSDHKKQMDRWQQIYSKVEHQQNQAVRNPSLGRLLKKKVAVLKSQEKRLNKEADNFLDIPDVEEAIDVFFDNKNSLPKGKRIIDIKIDNLMMEERVLAQNIELNVMGQDHICIIGRNGTGKTTLIREVYRQLQEKDGIKIGYMPQNYTDEMDFEKTAVDFLMQDVKWETREKALTFLGSMKFTRDEMIHKISDISGGQKAKLFILKMILDDCNVLILDEPTRNFSPLSAPVIIEMLKEFTGTIISVSHDRRYIAEVCDQVYEMSKEGLERIK